MIQVYQKGARIQISEHFNSNEFDCKDDLAYWTLIDDNLINLLEIGRSFFHEKYDKVIIRITSGYRIPSYNKEINGSIKSQHTCGKAADIQLFNNGDQIDPKEVYLFYNITNYNGGVGFYKTFTHVDVRDWHERWEG